MRYQCQFCRQLCRSEDSDAGKTVPCSGCGKEIEIPAGRFAVGSVISDFRITGTIAQGDMGWIYLAEKIGSGEKIALKILSQEHTYDANFIVSFVHEGRKTAKKSYSNAVKVYSAGEEDGVFYYAMEFVEGTSLAEYFRDGKKMPVDRACEIITAIAETLGEAWRNGGSIHRSIKPDNILITPDDRIKVADFGLARDYLDLASRSDEDRLRLVQYAAPEVFSDFSMTNLDTRSDIYSLGAVFYHAVTGAYPYQGFSVSEIISEQIPREPVAPDRLNPDLPEMIAKVILRMMAQDPKERYQNPEELLEALKSAQLETLPTVRISRKGNTSANAVTVKLPGKVRAGSLRKSKASIEPASHLNVMQRKRETRSQTIVCLIILALLISGIVFTLFIRWLVYEPRASAREMEINIARMKERAARRKSLYQPLRRGAPERLCRGVIALCSNEDFVAAQRYIRDFSRRFLVDPVLLELLTRHVKNSHIYFNMLCNSGSAAAGIEIQSHVYGLCKVSQVKDSVIYAETSARKKVTILIRAFTHEEYRWYLRQVTNKFGLYDQMRSYLLCTGNFGIALELARTDSERNEFETVIYGYVRSGLSNASPLEIRQMRMLYGSLEPFQRATHPE